MVDVNKTTMEQSELRELEKFAGRLNKFGVNFAVCNAEGELILLNEAGKFKSCREQIKKFARDSVIYADEKNNSNDGNTPACRYENSEQFLSVILESACTNNIKKTIIGTALIDVGNDSEMNNVDKEYFAEMLILLADLFKIRTKNIEQIEMVSTELARVYEELVLLHKISTNMRVTEDDSSFLQMACDSLTEIVFVEGIAILLQKNVDYDRKLVISAGSGLIDIDEQVATELHSRLMEELGNGKEALLDSEVDSPFRYNWSENIKNIIAVPLCGKDKNETHFSDGIQNSNNILGLMVAINRIGKQDFDSTDVKLFNSVASGCAVFIENGRLFKDLKELFIGSLKALTSSIDAKDKYTHGHSERVAYISRWIAERLSEVEPLDQEQIHEIYLTGLLHDIGKIGIDEQVLRKTGKLSDEEYDRIKVHPSIGASILREIKQMHEIVFGVLCHHERIDGRGYPNGLTGDKISLSGKIVSLADSFDAMTSRRTYRDAMTVEQALAEIEKGLGTQYDEKIGRIFLNSDIYQLWDHIRDGFNEIHKDQTAAEYETAAVETLIR